MSDLTSALNKMEVSKKAQEDVASPPEQKEKEEKASPPKRQGEEDKPSPPASEENKPSPPATSSAPAAMEEVTHVMSVIRKEEVRRVTTCSLLTSQRRRLQQRSFLHLRSPKSARSHLLLPTEDDRCVRVHLRYGR